MRLRHLFRLRRPSVTAPSRGSATDGFLYSYLWATFSVRPVDLRLYRVALTHRSVAHAKAAGHLPSNERLEFLGDAVLELVVSQYLYERFPHLQEGELTQLRAKIVCRASLNAWAEAIGLVEAMRRVVGPVPDSRQIPGNTLEAFLGAMFLDLGLEPTARAFVECVLARLVDWDDALANLLDYKSRLFDWAQKYGHTVGFDVVPIDQHPPMFYCRLVIDGVERLTASGTSKKRATQNACLLYIKSPAYARGGGS